MEFKNYKDAESKYEIQSGSGFMTLLPGDNKIRIVSVFEDHGSHWSEPHKRSFVCVGKENKCPFCLAEVKPTVKYMGWVIDRKDKKVKLMTIGHSIFKLIGALAASKEYAFDSLPKYDITIGKTGEKKATRYSVIADRKDSPLTKKEEELIAKTAKRSPKDIVSEMKAKMCAAVEDAQGDEKINMDSLSSGY